MQLSSSLNEEVVSYKGAVLVVVSNLLWTIHNIKQNIRNNYINVKSTDLILNHT